MAELLLALILAALAVGEVPPFHFNRATLAVVGAVIVLVVGLIPLEEAFAAIDWNTLALLFAMMVFTAHLRLAGFFDLAGTTLSGMAHSPAMLLGVVLGVGALLSALFINDTVVLLLTPLLARLTLGAGLNPMPFLIGLAVSSNIGSMVTPVGNPQNILIASSSGLGFGDFAAALAVPALASLALTWGLMVVRYRKDLTARKLRLVPDGPPRVHRPMLVKCAVALVVMVGGFVLGWSLALSALAGAAVLLFTRRVKPAKVLGRIDGGLLLMFAALFIITKAVASTQGFRWLMGQAQPLLVDNLALMTGVTALFSNLISNVPAVMILMPLISTLPNPDEGWIVLAAASTLAGNLTLLGSVANLIVAESARPFGIKVGFMDYLRVGLPVTVASIALTTAWLAFT